MFHIGRQEKAGDEVGRGSGQLRVSSKIAMQKNYPGNYELPMANPYLARSEIQALVKQFKALTGRTCAPIGAVGPVTKRI